MSENCIIEINNLHYLNEYMNSTISNRVSNNLTLNFSHYILRFKYQSNNYLIFIFYYHDKIENHYQLVFNKIVEYTRCMPTILYKFISTNNPYLSLSFFALINADPKKQFYNSKLLKLFQSYEFKNHIRIVCISNMESHELQTKLKLLNSNPNIITYEDLNKLYTIHIFTNYTNNRDSNISII